VLEDEAIPWYELEFNKKINRVGFITRDDQLIGCSPDGLLEDGEGIEIKSPEAHTHVGYLLEGVLPTEYAVQVQSCMYVTDADSWNFISYRRGFPKLVLKVGRDEKAQSAIGEALEKFLADFENAKDQMIQLNGGPPKRGLTPMPRNNRPTSAFVSETPS
jgi:hypothetical protein